MTQTGVYLLGVGGGQDSLSRDPGTGTFTEWGVWAGWVQGLTVGDGHPSAERREGCVEERSQEGGQLWLGVPPGCCEEVSVTGAWSLQTREPCPFLT